jgi:hypothetical protein
MSGDISPRSPLEFAKDLQLSLLAMTPQDPLTIATEGHRAVQRLDQEFPDVYLGKNLCIQALRTYIFSDPEATSGNRHNYRFDEHIEANGVGSGFTFFMNIWEPKLRTIIIGLREATLCDKNRYELPNTAQSGTVDAIFPVFEVQSIEEI